MSMLGSAVLATGCLPATRLGALPAPPCAAPARLRRRRRCVQASAAPELEQAAAGGALLDALPAVPPVPSPEELEAREELALAAGKGDIYGIPRSEWLKLQSPARYLGNEFGAVHKAWGSAEIRFALTYPEIYEVGASNLGHVILYSILNQQEGLLCDRAYFPGTDMHSLLARYGRRLFGVESRRPLNDFDVLGFSLSYELGGTNILEMLKQAGVPVTWQERNEEAGKPWDPATGSAPLIFAGGPTATSNPEPFADFFDFVALGDGEELLVEIGQCLRRCRAAGLDRDSTLFSLATQVEGVYVPQFYDAPGGWGGAVFPNREGVPPRVKRRVCAPDPFQQIGLVPFVDTVHNRLTVEIRRGCTRGCRFCQPGMLTRPARDVEPSRVVDAVEHGMRTTGYNEFSLLSLSCSDYLALPSVGIQIKNRLKDENVALSLPSQRVDRFDDDIANIVTNSAKRSGLTFAPEAGTQRLRDIINKGLTNEELLRGVKTAWDKGWRQIKLYFMIGLPGETDADVMGIAETVEWLQRECRQGKWHLAVNVTISNFTPKPHTPFQWHSVSTSEFVRKQEMLRKAMYKLFQVKANFTPVNISAMEDFIGRGDRSIGRVIHRAWQLGATNDVWWQSEEAAFNAWSQAAKDCDMDWKYRQVENGEWDVLEAVGDARFRGQGGGGKGRVDRGLLADQRLDAPLPWDHIDTGIAKWWLKTDLQRALEAATVPDCSHSGICTECGVCDDGEHFGENVVHEPPPIPEFEGHYRPNATKAQRLRFRFAKEGDMVFVGHLDLMKTFDRACRRAALPVSADESPFAVRQRIYAALPLPLGATSASEWLEVTLTDRFEPEVIRNKLQAQLPGGLQLLSVEEALVKKIDGSNGEKMAQLLDSVEYYLVVEETEAQQAQQAQQHAAAEAAQQQQPTAPGGSGGSGGGATLAGVAGLRGAVAGAVAAEEFVVHKAAKKGRNRGGRWSKKKASSTDLRWAVESMEAVGAAAAVAAGVPAEVLGGAGGGAPLVVRVRSACANGNPVLGPAAVLAMLNAAAAAGDGGQENGASDAPANGGSVGEADGEAGGEAGGGEAGSSSSGRYALAHIHRSDIRLRPMPVPQPDMLKLRSLCRMEGHLGAAQQAGAGPWSTGLENRPRLE
ncbi:Radical SAM domain [Micractinium conductrix]|uniref:Radical SAM domain n=1 Tax=Micractinium conductrix TaxID=554055 RepID=A0A2P6VE91_9CHLO|nr:Radical SAM domain [Micractinium conductrix]|eukprot:PSC72413.1 Radical SAM domain [Micractinium conductrix]